MKNRPFSLWKIIIHSLIAYTLIYALPTVIMVTARNYNTNKQIDIYNRDAAIVDEFNHAFVNENLKEHLPYDYSLLEDLYEKLDLDPEDTFERARQPHSRHWRAYAQSQIIESLIDHLVFGLMNHNVCSGLIFYLSCVFIGLFLTLFIYNRDQNKFLSKLDPLEWLRKKLKVHEIPFNLIILLTIFFTAIGITMLIQHTELDKIISQFVKSEIAVFIVFIFIQCFLYLLYLITKHINKLKSTKLASIFDSLSILIISGTVILISLDNTIFDRISTIFSHSTILLSSKIIPYANSGRFIAFGLIILLLALLCIGLLFLLYKIISKRDQEFRLNYLLNFSPIFFTCFGLLITLSPQMEINSSIVQKQVWNSRVGKLTTAAYKIDAEVYQWYHLQQDAKASTKTIPALFTSYLEARDDIDFTYNWDGIIMETKIQYEQIDGEVKTITHNLNAESGELDVSGETDKNNEE